MDIQRGLYLSTSMFDVILSVGEIRFKAHQLVLSACSPFLNEILSSHQAVSTVPPIIILPDINVKLVDPLMRFMYSGETLVPSAYVRDFLDACTFLQIKGLDASANEYGTILSSFPSAKSPQLPPTSVTSNHLVPHKNETIDVNLTETTLSDANDDNNKQMMTELIGAEEYLEDISEEDANSLNFTTIASPLEVDDETIADAAEPVAAEIENSEREIVAEIDRPRKTPQILSRNERNSLIELAMRAVNEYGCSLKEASTQYKISKTALWRHLKQSKEYKPEDRQNRCQRTDAMAAIERGETLISISKRLDIPLSTLHRHKVRLFDQGKLPDNSKLTRRDATPGYQRRLAKAVASCRNGMTQKRAADLYRVPKTTIWRHLQANKRQQQQQHQQDGITTSSSTSTMLISGTSKLEAATTTLNYEEFCEEFKHEDGITIGIDDEQMNLT